MQFEVVTIFAIEMQKITLSKIYYRPIGNKKTACQFFS